MPRAFTPKQLFWAGTGLIAIWVLGSLLSNVAFTVVFGQADASTTVWVASITVMIANVALAVGAALVGASFLAVRLDAIVARMELPRSPTTEGVRVIPVSTDRS